MSSAPSRTRPSIGRVVRGIAWGALLVVLAASGAGLAGLAWHAPGSPARAELTYAGDSALGARLDVASAEVERIAANVASLADEAKTALEEVASFDQARIEASLERGEATASAIDEAAHALQDSLVDLPGAEPDAAMRYSNATLVRRAAILASIDAATGLAGLWQTVAARAADTSRLTELITQHDTIVITATEDGRLGEFRDAAATLDRALVIMSTIQAMRKRLVEAGQTVLDEWIQRTRAYDKALRKLYLALVKSKGKVTVAVQSARREERAAFDQLPPDRRTILVIISEVTRNGLTQAVLALEEAHGVLDDALADVAEASAPPS